MKGAAFALAAGLGAVAAALQCPTVPEDPEAEAQAADPDILKITDVGVALDGVASPTDVAIGDDGAIYVLDGDAGSVLVLATDGTPQRALAVDGEPVGLGIGAGRLWVPRTDRPELQVIDPATGERETWTVDGAALDARLTDVAVCGDQVVVVANGGGPWLRSLDDGAAWHELVLEPPLGVGFLASCDGDERLAVGDVLHDQVLVVEVDGEERRDLGKWGVWEGSVLHPTGVAFDRRGRVFVADGSLGVVQAFDRKGAFLGALGRDGELLRMEHPLGLAIQGDRLLALDWGTGRVLSMEVDDRTRPLTPNTLYDRKVPRISYLVGDNDPTAMLSPVCQSCHDGSVRLSARVWAAGTEHHPVDTVPTKAIPAPFTLDSEGRLYCGTCHIPHRMSSETSGDEAGMEVFLKEPRARSALCLACHTDVVAEVRKVDGPIPEAEAGHLVGEVPRKQARLGAGAIDDAVGSVECLDCHAPHGAVGEMLLSPAAARSDGCTRCHVGVSVERGARTHPVDRPLASAAAVQDLTMRGVFLGPDDTVACLTCHDVHRSPRPDWLTERLGDDERCVLCHREQVTLQGGAHDLRQGQRTHVATACLACHTIHDAAGPALGLSGGDLRDPTDCQRCHGPGGEAEVHVASDAHHPLFEPNDAPSRLPSVGADGSMAMGAPGNTSCLTCHDPHATTRGGNHAMLRLPGGDAGTCIACHPETAAALGSDHDLRLTSSPQADARDDEMESAGFCLGCHGMHEGEDWHLWAAPRGGEGSPAVSACLGCHEPGNRAGGTVVQAWDHPGDLLLTTAKVPWSNTGELPLFDAQGYPTDDKQIGEIACLTCHDPHVWSPKRGGQGGRGEGDTQTSFLRDGWEGFCAGCHGEESLAVYRYFHDPGFREEMRSRSERRDWPLYGEDGS